MQKTFVIFAIAAVSYFIGSSDALAQTRTFYGEGRTDKKSMIDVHAGYLDPSGTQAGMLFGVALQSNFDEAVDVGFGFDVFQKSYSEETEVSTGQNGDTQTTIVATRMDYRRTALPLYASLKIKIPGLISRANDQIIFGYFARASISYQFLFSDEKNYEANKSENRKYAGWGWQAGGGIYYRVGARSTLIAEAIYNNCTVSRDVSKQTDQLPLTERVSLAGLGLRVGVELDIR